MDTEIHTVCFAQGHPAIKGGKACIQTLAYLAQPPVLLAINYTSLFCEICSLGSLPSTLSGLLLEY